ncbi:MOSC domain-containing protein [Arthrobacter woluwensis]|uniref:MOSC domain-containing protein YiiM n=1 Tax=Arthrobacter woluwensis TaxID=156980 RepID=A0A1H4LVD9_9MICC|nr:MOSC domain-containing protein [Arthrobacter woluwensis]MBO9704234.1 MOSC domain-containing protein [Arthrobacter sp.]PSS42831.1 MOSC domain-containing protein [Arthrobacter woluwensis]QTF72370.1 MOSC domain-containing protein [Arthrobacter woluwensis]SEB74537.1 MOSC domain-containing protein YiiM [Arthrobacter woluwensis]
MHPGTVLAVCRVHELRPDPEGRVGVTAIDKRPVEGPVTVHRLGLHGDIQADRANHGGFDQAVYAYSQEDADHWAAELGRDVPAGYFGENLRLAGIATTQAVIGERWRIGTDVELEVTSPRVPCATFQRRVEEAAWVRRFTQEGRVGCYLRVIKTGDIREGDHVHRVYVPDHGITVGQWFSEPTLEMIDALRDAEADGHIVLQDEYHVKFEKLEKRLGR